MSAILLVKTSSLGDIVHNLPVVADIRARDPGARIDWVVEEAFAAIPRLHPGVREVIPVAVRRWRRTLHSPSTWREMGAFRRALASRDYDAVIDTQGLVKSALVTRAARGRRCGYSAEAAREPLAARFYDSTYAIPRNLHAVERNRWLVAAALGNEPGGPLEYGIRASAPRVEWLPQGSYAVLLTATSREDKLWAETHWLALAADLHARGVTAVLPGGSEAERARAQRLAQNMRRAIAAPALSIDALATVLSGARLVVGVDTGLTHLAAALGVPVLALFCGSDPRLTGVHAGERARNLGALMRPPSPQDAIAAAQALLAR